MYAVYGLDMNGVHRVVFASERELAYAVKELLKEKFGCVAITVRLEGR